MTMTTTLTRTPGSDGAAGRLEALLPLIRATGRRWARRIGRYGADGEDLAQEAALGLWRVLRERPDAPVAFLKEVAASAARDFLKRGKSVDRPLPKERKHIYQTVSLEVLMGDEEGWDSIEASLIRRRHRGELPDSTYEVALASILYRDLRSRLTPQQRRVLELRLQGYTREEIGSKLGVGPTRVNTLIVTIRQKARPLWEEELHE